MKIDESELLIDDGLLIPAVGDWSKVKHRKVGYYSSLFAQSMKRQWDCRVYIDLFSCAGLCKVRSTNEILLGSPLMSLNIDPCFDKYVFCEAKLEFMEALQTRVGRHFSDRECTFITGDSNVRVDALLDCLPSFSRDYKGLSLCFVDPYKKGELKFSTIAKIAERIFVDFLVLIPTYMDIHRNEGIYIRPEDDSLDTYLGTKTWREKWHKRENHNQQFGLFIADQFGQQMRTLGFVYEGLGDMELVRMESDKNVPLYHLAFFSKHKLGLRFWRETIRNTNDQYRMPF